MHGKIWRKERHDEENTVTTIFIYKIFKKEKEKRPILPCLYILFSGKILQNFLRKI